MLEKLKNKKRKYHYILIITTLTFLLIFNIWYYKNNKQELDLGIYSEFKIYNKIIDLGLVYNLKKIISGQEFCAFTANLIFDAQPINSIDSHHENIKITPYSIEIHNKENHISIDIISLKEYFQNTLPPYFDYKIKLNEYLIIKKSFANSLYKTPIKYDLENGMTLNVILDIDQIFYSQKIQEIRIKQLYYGVFSVLAYLLVALIYASIFKLVQNIVHQLEKKVLEQKTNIANYENRIEAHENININFIKKATAIYLNEINGYDSVNVQLFPLVLIDKLHNNINLLKLQTIIKNYFRNFYKKIKVEIKIFCNNAYYPIGEEVFYQLIISIIDNISSVIQGQTDKERTIEITINESVIKFKFISFPLSLKKIEQLSHFIYKNNPKTFILDFTKVIDSLTQHDIEYKIRSENNINLFEIEFIKTGKQKNVFEFVAKKEG